MKPFTISAAFALLVAFAQAAPTPDHANITFHGADSDAGYTLSFPVDGSVITISMSLGDFHIVPSPNHLDRPTTFPFF